MDQTEHQLVGQSNKTIQFWDPIEELQLEVSKNNKQDYQQIVKLLTVILAYPSTQFANQHMQCNRLGQRDLRKEVEQLKKIKSQRQNQLGEQASYCPCCGFIKQEDNIKLCTPLKQINNLGISTFLYFQTAKNLGLLLFALFIIYSIYALVTNLISSNKINLQQQEIDTTADILSISLASKLTDQTDQNKTFYLIQCYIGLGVVVIWCAMLFILKYFEKQQEVRVQEQTISVADFSIVIQYMPRDITQQDLQKQFNDYFQTINNVPVNMKKPFKIEKYNVGKPFYLNEDALIDDEVKQLKKKHQEYVQLFVSWIQQRQDSTTFSTTKQQRQKKYQQFNQILQKMNQKSQQLAKKVQQQMKKENNQTVTTVFVTFQTSYAKNLIVSLNDPTFLAKLRYYLTCCQGGNRFKLIKSDGGIADIQIQDAPQPQDVIWQNLGVSDCQILKRKILTYTVTFILLGVSFAAVFGLSQAQTANQQNRALSLAISLVISLINVILGQVIRILTVLQKDFTQTKHQASLGFKSTLAQLINSILVPMIVNAVIKQKIYDQNGLAADVFMLGLTNAFIGPIIKVFDPGFIINRLVKWLKSKPSRRLSLNQQQLNQKFQYIQFEVGYQYIYLVNLFLFTCFFVSLQPILAITSCVGIFCMYWAQKYAIFNRMKRPVPGTDTINVAMFQLIYLGGIFYSLGSLTWSNFFPQGFPKQALIPNLIALGISVLIALLPYKAIFSLVFQQQTSLCLQYKKNRILLASEYDRLNPSTAKQGFKDYMEFIQKQRQKLNSVSDQEKKKFQEKLKKQNARGQQRPSGTGPNPLLGLLQQPVKNPINQMMPPPNQNINQPPGFQPQQSNIPPPTFIQQPLGFNQPPPGFNQPPGFNRPPIGFNQVSPGFVQRGYQPPPMNMPPGYRAPGFQPAGFRPVGFQQGFNPYQMMRR